MARRESELEIRRLNADSPSNETVIKRRGYFVDKLIGFGTYADVYKLVCADLTQQPAVIACKIIDAGRAPKEYIERFLPRELEILTKLFHPNIIHIVSVIQRSQKFFIFMRYAEKGDLLEYLLSYGALTEKQAKIWFRQVVLAVNYIHQLNITHRDIKCENILVTQNYNLKLTDFGFARFTVDSQGKQKLSQTFCGSLGYASPEILKGKTYDPKASDVWSLGVVLFVMMNKSMPFYGNDVRYLYKQQMEQKWTLNESIASTISKEGKEIITSMLVPAPKKRSTAENLINNEWFKMDKRFQNDIDSIFKAAKNDMRPVKKNRLNLDASNEVKIAQTKMFSQSMLLVDAPINTKANKADASLLKADLEAKTLPEEIRWKELD